MALVLLMDDEKNLALMLETALVEAGHQVIKTENGQAGIDRLEETPLPDIVLVDLDMPVVSGYEVVDWISSNLRVKDIPRIIITGADLGLDRFPPRENYHRLFNKPFILRDLIQAIAELTTEKIH